MSDKKRKSKDESIKSAVCQQGCKGKTGGQSARFGTQLEPCLRGGACSGMNVSDAKPKSTKSVTSSCGTCGGADAKNKSYKGESVFGSNTAVNEKNPKSDAASGGAASKEDAASGSKGTKIGSSKIGSSATMKTKAEPGTETAEEQKPEISDATLVAALLKWRDKKRSE